MRIWGFVFTVMLAVCFAHVAAPAQEEQPLKPMTEAQFWAAKAAAGGVLNDELTIQAVNMTKQKLHGVQLALERFAVDRPDSTYPQHINQVVREGYIDAGFYANPFTAASADARDAVEVPFGWSDQHPGNFSYIQRYDPTREMGQDVDGDGQPDGVIIMLESSMVPFEQLSEDVYSGGRPVKLESSK